MENNKYYYTPTIEEFHIGFEYELLTDHHDIWDSYQIEDKHDLFDALTETTRVKYLDQSDIESLGWKKEENCFVKNNYKLYLYGNTHIQIQSSGNLNFNGTIKNKSELKKLMQQLGII